MTDLHHSAPSDNGAQRTEASEISPDISVVVPVKNEAGNVVPLITEIRTALAQEHFEIIYVDDGSDDATPQELIEAKAEAPELRVIRHKKSCGQSAAVRSGVRAARAPLVATLDGDGQNDPADLPNMIKRYRAASPADNLRMVIGHRVNRRDNQIKRMSSRIANGVRVWLLNDDTPDTGCGIKVFCRRAFLQIPFFDHVHRFMPALFQREGYTVANEPVNHRPRNIGTSKYGIGNRLWVGISDMFGVRWLQHRMKRPEIVGDDV